MSYGRKLPSLIQADIFIRSFPHSVHSFHYARQLSLTVSQAQLFAPYCLASFQSFTPFVRLFPSIFNGINKLMTRGLHLLLTFAITKSISLT